MYLFAWLLVPSTTAPASAPQGLLNSTNMPPQQQIMMTKSTARLGIRMHSFQLNDLESETSGLGIVEFEVVVGITVIGLGTTLVGVIGSGVVGSGTGGQH